MNNAHRIPIYKLIFCLERSTKSHQQKYQFASPKTIRDNSTRKADKKKSVANCKPLFSVRSVRSNEGLEWIDGAGERGRRELSGEEEALFPAVLLFEQRRHARDTVRDKGPAESSASFEKVLWGHRETRVLFSFSLSRLQKFAAAIMCCSADSWVSYLPPWIWKFEDTFLVADSTRSSRFTRSSLTIRRKFLWRI